MRIQILILGFKGLNTDYICLGLQASLTFHIRRSRLLTSANMNVRTDDFVTTKMSYALSTRIRSSFENATFFRRFQKNSRPLVTFSHRLRPSTSIR